MGVCVDASIVEDDGCAKVKEMQYNGTYHSPLVFPRPSPLAPDLASRFEFCPAAADAKLEGRFEGILTGRLQKRPSYLMV
jgi:hypothetical protein